MDKFSVLFTQLAIGHSFTSTGRTFFRNRFIWSVLPREYDRPFRDQCFYLEQSSIGCKKFQIVPPKLFWQVSRVFYLVYYRPNFYSLTLPSKLIDMSCAYSLRVTESLEISGFIWNDLILAAKSYKECTLNDFWQVFSFFYSVQNRPNFYFYLPTLLSELIHMSCVSSVRVTEPLVRSVFICSIYNCGESVLP